jgi:hypothetical protein
MRGVMASDADADADRPLFVFALDPAGHGPADFGGSRSFGYETTGGRRTRLRLDTVDDPAPTITPEPPFGRFDG